MTEPDVALTDYGLAIECAVLVYLLYRRRDRDEHGRPLRFWLALFLGSGGVGALIGGTVHGFFSDAGTAGAAILWPTSLLAIGASALAAWVIGARIQFSEAVARRIEIAAALEFAAYGFVVLFGARAFTIAVINYLSAAMFLLVVFLLAYRRTRERLVLVGTLGLAATFVAAGIQQGGVGLHLMSFDHNALYHVIQAGALLMLFLGFRWFVVSRGVRGPC